MSIDWFTMGAQAVNFLTLVWLLKRFLYAPILAAIDERERLVAATLATAAAKEAEAETARDTYLERLEQLDGRRDELLRQAQDEAHVERERLLDEARSAADALRAERREALRREQQRLNDDLLRRARDEIFAIARKTLADLAGTSLEDRVSAVFCRRLRELTADARLQLAKVVRASADVVVVRSAFELSAEQRASIRDVLDEALATEVHARFETDPALISGIELSTDGHRVSWSIADYLASLEHGVSELLGEQAGSES